ncbi:hypothetical protein ACSX1C_13980 [Pseudomonas sp. MBLB4123]|uniref:hypothetical protein n=1 Tax=Pseudomonas sp. MBLB4123 TaxID=3451557 RepID=UPI003F74FF64
MTRFNAVVVPFPKRYEPLDCLDGQGCHFQAAAELRVAMLHKLFDILARMEASTPGAGPLHEACDSARALLSDVLVLYRRALAQAQGRAGDE